jgi:hypothetical protein
MTVLARMFPCNKGEIAAWFAAEVKPAPTDRLAQDLIRFLTYAETINTIMILSHGRVVELQDGYDAREFWAELYTAWYEHASTTLGGLTVARSFEDAAASTDPLMEEIGQVACKHLFIEGATTFFERHGFDKSLLPDLKPDTGYDSLEMWTLIFYNAVQFGGMDLWKAIVAASDKTL